MTAVPEAVRRTIASVLQWGGWGGALFMIIYSALNYDPSRHELPPSWYGLTTIFLVGVAIAGTTVRSRMRITDTIVRAFEAGYDASQDRRAATDALRAARQVRHEKDG
jgi:hypothetical protein